MLPIQYKWKANLFSVVIIALVLISCGQGSEIDENSIKGSVKLSNTNKHRGTTVRVTPGGKETTTDSQGGYIIDLGGETGDMEIEVYHKGYVEAGFGFESDGERVLSDYPDLILAEKEQNNSLPRLTTRVDGSHFSFGVIDTVTVQTIPDTARATLYTASGDTEKVIMAPLLAQFIQGYTGYGGRISMEGQPAVPNNGFLSLNIKDDTVEYCYKSINDGSFYCVTFVYNR